MGGESSPGWRSWHGMAFLAWHDNLLLSAETWDTLGVFLQYPEVCRRLRTITIAPDPESIKLLKEGRFRTPAGRRNFAHFMLYIKSIVNHSPLISAFHFDLPHYGDVKFNVPKTVRFPSAHPVLTRAQGECW